MSAISDWQFKEILAAATVPAKINNLIDLPIPQGLTDRRIYCYAEVKQSVANSNFTFIGEIVLYKNGQIIAKYPVELAISAVGQTNLSRSIVCLANSGGSPVGDCVSLVLQNPFSVTTLNAILQPIRLNAPCDRAVFNILDVSGTVNTGYRVALGILSQSN